MDLSYDFSTLWHHVLEQLSYNPGEPLMFSSGLFWVLAIVFLPLYGMLKSRRTQMMLFVIAFSLFFSYKSSGWYFLLLVATSLIDWWVARRIHASSVPATRKGLLWLSLVLSAGTLLAFKYTNFALANLSALVQSNFQPLDIVLPIGISFYTFRTISYVVDVYKGKLQPTDSYLEYLFFLSFFPCLVAGPIVRASEFMPQLRANKRPDAQMIYGGLWLFMIGVLKKAVVADYIAQYVNIAYGNPTGYSGVELLMAIVGYTMQIYCDFSGYSDMAIGLGSVMGYDLGVNFDLPYRSRSVTEFWRRWHMSLSFWLRDYVYISMGGNRRGKVRQYVNLMTTMLVGGLWHGAAWTFVFWGAGHGLALCVHKALLPSLKKIPDSWPVKFLSWLTTFVVVSLLWVFFRADSFTTAWQVISGTFSRFDPAYFPVFASVRSTWCIMMAVAFAAHFVPKRIVADLRQMFIDSFWIFKLLLFIVVVQLVVHFAAADVQPFIYAQF